MNSPTKGNPNNSSNFRIPEKLIWNGKPWGDDEPPTIRSSTAKERRKWILTTCRGRLAHLRESLPSWLERLPGWEPIVVTCDDPEATEYAAGELKLAGRGFVLSITQGQYFNKLEALRAGMLLVGQDVDGTGESFDELWPLLAPPRSDINATVCILDADIVATAGTLDTLNRVSSNDVAICGWGASPDDYGFLVAPGGLLWRAMALLGVDAFEGYGPEDMALRICLWSLLQAPFLELPAEWAHRQHTDASRSRWHRVAVRGASQANSEILNRLIESLISPNQRERMGRECMQSPKPRALYRAG